jgi:CheY-like chemotaxis protein
MKEAHAIAGGATARISSYPPAPERTGPKAILVVDDDPVTRAALVKALAGKFEVHEAADGLAAAELAGRIPNLALLVSDVNMPRLDGFALARMLKAHPTLKRVGIVFVTSRAAPQDVMRAMSIGARHVVTKPFSAIELAGKLEKMVA